MCRGRWSSRRSCAGLSPRRRRSRSPGWTKRAGGGRARLLDDSSSTIERSPTRSRPATRRLARRGRALSPRRSRSVSSSIVSVSVKASYTPSVSSPRRARSRSRDISLRSRRSFRSRSRRTQRSRRSRRLSPRRRRSRRTAEKKAVRSRRRVRRSASRNRRTQRRR